MGWLDVNVGEETEIDFPRIRTAQSLDPLDLVLLKLEQTVVLRGIPVAPPLIFYFQRPLVSLLPFPGGQRIMNVPSLDPLDKVELEQTNASFPPQDDPSYEVASSRDSPLTTQRENKK
ncbi:hypothetical protein TNCT_149351 [Trichonephila clavata]|uniref:Uncharacterized protein n=1 Tax=Trichonephila clavata TaxID=2740835 RepID=A0A8X6FSJ4_TRICU|nr:hypothetical protein TNCT_149351 [Trichonephila clavata]